MPNRRQLRLGVDIGSSAVKVAVVKSPPRRAPVLLDYVIEPLPQDAVEAKHIRRVSLVNTALKAACKKLRQHPQFAYLAIPTASATTRQITLPSGLNAMAIEARVSLAAEEQINSATEPLCVDYCAAQDQQITLTATRQCNVDERTALLRGTRLMAGGIDLEAYAMIRAIQLGLSANAPSDIGIVDLGEHTLNLTVLSHGQLMQARDQVLHGDLSDSQQTADAVKRLLALFTGSGTTAGPAQLMIGGGRASDADLLSRIEQVTALPVSRPDLSLVLKGCPEPDTAARLITAVGLALPSG